MKIKVSARIIFQNQTSNELFVAVFRNLNNFLNKTFYDLSLICPTFDCIDAAVRAKETLHGADIYSGCCTLKIDFAKVSDLHFYPRRPSVSPLNLNRASA